MHLMSNEREKCAYFTSQEVTRVLNSLYRGVAQFELIMAVWERAVAQSGLQIMNT